MATNPANYMKATLPRNVSTTDNTVDSLLSELDTRVTESADRLNLYIELENVIRNGPNAFRGDGDVPISLNFPRKFYERHAEFMAKGFDIVIPDDIRTQESEDSKYDFISGELEEVWEYNGKVAISAQTAQTASLLGDAFIHVAWEPETETPLFQVVHPSLIFPKFDPVTKRIVDCFVIQPTGTTTHSNTNYLTVRAARTLRENYRIIYYAQPDKPGDNYKKILIVGDMPDDYEEAQLAIPMVPVVHIMNYPNPNSDYGESDIFMMRGPAKELIARAQGAAVIMDYHGSPLTYIKGQQVGNTRNSNPWNILELGADTEIGNIEMKSDLASTLEMMKFLKTAMFELGSLPPFVLGDVPGAMTVTSMAGAFGVANDRCLIKSTFYAKAFAALNEIVIRMAEANDREFARKLKALKPRRRYMTQVVFKPALDRDEAIELANSQARVDIGISSVKQEAVRHGLTRTKASAVYEERQLEKKADAEIGAIAKAKASGNPAPKRVNGASVGAKESVSKGSTKTKKS